MNKSKIEMTKGEAIDYLSRCANGLDSEFDEAVKLAVAALQTQIEAERKKPLTLDELRKMDGKLVRIERIGGRTPYDNAVAFVRTGYSLCRTADGCNAYFELYGTSWLAYRLRTEEDINGQEQRG